jgi:hypothetical protein
MAPKITSTTVNHHPTAPAVPLSRIGFQTLLAVVLAIIALFTPILLRGQSLRPQFLGSQLSRYFSSQSRPITATTDTMSEVKLSPRDLKEWNQYVTKAGGRVIADMRQFGRGNGPIPYSFPIRVQQSLQGESILG